MTKVHRYIRHIFAPAVGELWTNDDLLARIGKHLQTVDQPQDAKESLQKLIRLFLIGSRSRYVQCPNFLDLRAFSEHAEAFAAAANESLAILATEIRAAGGPKLDAIIGVSSAGQILPGIADRTANLLGDLVDPTTCLLDLGNGGCTASSRALQLVANFGSEIREALIVIAEPTSTLADAQTLDRANWQGICTFGDGAAAVWLTMDRDRAQAELKDIHSFHGKEAGLIQWDHGGNYYRFGITESDQFERRVRSQILEAMNRLEPSEHDDNTLWAVHPAGMMLVLSVARRLGIDRAGLEPSIRHFRQFSNMSSASVIHILKELLDQANPGRQFRWLSMGAGFHVVSGSGRKL